MNASAPVQGGVVTPALVPYAGVAARWGVSIARDADAVRVSVAPVPSWRHLGAGFLVSAAVLATIVAGWLYAGVVARAVPPEVYVTNVGLYGVPLAAVLAVAVARLRRRIVVSVTGAGVALGILHGRGTGRWAAWPRAKVSEIKINPFNGKLLIRVRNEDLVERYLGPNREAAADELAAALRDVPVNERAGDAGVPPADAVAARSRRRVLGGLGVALLVVAGAMFLMPFPFPVLGFYVLLGSAAPFGILYGTQDKQFYV